MLQARFRNGVVALAAVALILALAPQLHAQPAQTNLVKVLIGFQQTPGASEQALVRAFGGTIRHSYTIVPAIAATVPEAAIQGLQRNPLVTRVEPDVRVHATAQTVPWGITHINADDVQAAGNTGNAVKVCVIDSGMQLSHPDLSLNYAGGYDFVNPDDDYPDDDNGHGTHTAGTVAAVDNSEGVVGVAPGVDLLIYKILGADGSGDFGDAIAAVEACVAAGGQITNNSYGSSVDPGEIVRQAFDNAYYGNNEWGRKVLHVASAGNSGSRNGKGDTIGYPARYASVMAVAAVDESHQRPYWSSYGDELEISAPGVNILSTYPTNTYATASGTSMASPHVAGVAALVAAGCGLTDPALIREKLTSTAVDLGTTGWDRYYGHGLVQADLATNCTPPEPVTDLAVVSVSAPDTVTQNVGATVEVLVSNTGNQQASDFSVELTDNGVAVGSPQTVPTLAAGAATTLSFAWLAPNTGQSTLTASLVQTDDDLSNNFAFRVVQVSEQGTAGPFTLSATGYVKGVQRVDLTWSGANSANVDVYRNSALIVTTPNSGQYTDNLGKKLSGDFTYQVCEAGTPTCSNEATVTF